MTTAKERFKYIADFFPLPLALIDEQGRYEYINPVFTEVFGYTLAQLSTKERWFELAYPDPLYRQEILRLWAKDMEQNSREVVVPRVLQVTCGDKSVKEIFFRTVRMDNGKILQICEDVTARRRAEKELQESEERARRQLDAVTRLVLDEAVVSGRVVEALQRITRELSAATAVERASIWLLSKDKKELKCLSLYEASKGRHTDGGTLQTAAFPRYFAALSFESRIYAEDAQADPRTRELAASYLIPLGITSLLDAGVIMDGELVGVVSLEHTGSVRRWHPDEEAFASTAASLVAQLFASTARREAEQLLAEYIEELEGLYRQLDEELEKALRVHERIMPQALPALRGLSFAAHYQPARKLGGDFYDILEKEGKVVFYLSDVSGHGLDGAMLSMFVRHTVKNYVHLTPASHLAPSKILRHLAAEFREENFPEELYLCIFLVVLDLKGGELSCCGAGFQEAPLALLGNGEKKSLVTRGLFVTSYLPLDLLTYNEVSLPLTPGTTLFFHTDGLTEQSVSGDYYRERLAQVFYAHAALPPGLIAAAVNEDFRHFNGGSLQGKDDITFLVLQVDRLGTQKRFLKLKSDFHELNRLRQQAEAIIIEDSLAAQTFLGSLHELVANAIEHGNCFDPGKAVFVELVSGDGYLYASVRDEGEGFNWSARLERPLEMVGSEERGRGIAMVRLLCDLTYNAKGNTAMLLVRTDTYPRAEQQPFA